MSVFTEDQIQQLARELNQSEKSRVQIEHFSKRYPGMTIEDGYRINRAWMQLKFAEGRTLIGHSWPAEGIRRLLAIPRSIHELIWGLLLLQVIGLQPVIAVIAIAIPYGALVARVVSDLLDSLNERNLQALMAAGTAPPAALLSAMGPPLLPGLISYGGYRLECALRSATLLGVFGLGGLGTELRLTLQSLAFNELWSGLWALLVVMLLLEALMGWLRRRWACCRRSTAPWRRKPLTWRRC